MKRQLTVLGLTTFGTLALHAAPALADEQVTQEVQVYGGEIFGDRLTETPISGRHAAPERYGDRRRSL